MTCHLRTPSASHSSLHVIATSLCILCGEIGQEHGPTHLASAWRRHRVQMQPERLRSRTSINENNTRSTYRCRMQNCLNAINPNGLNSQINEYTSDTVRGLCLVERTSRPGSEANPLGISRLAARMHAYVTLAN